MCLFSAPVMFIGERMSSVVPAGMVTMGHVEDATAFKNAGASSEPLAATVHGLDAPKAREARATRVYGSNIVRDAVASRGPFGVYILRQRTRLPTLI